MAYMPESKASSLAPLLVAVALSALITSAAGVVVAFSVSGNSAMSFRFDMVTPWLAGGVAAGVVEEFVFRGALFLLFCKAFELRGAKAPALAAALVSAALFAMLHVLSSDGFVVPQSAVEWAQFCLKPLQAFFFGLGMTVLYARTGSLALPMAVHVLYDLVCFAPLMLFAGAEVTTHLTGVLTEAVALCITLPVLALPLILPRSSCRLSAECVSTVRKR